MITIKRVNTLSKEAYERYRQDPRHGASRDREAFCDAVKAVVVTGLVFEAAQIVLGAAAETEAGGRGPQVKGTPPERGHGDMRNGTGLPLGIDWGHEAEMPVEAAS
jgi:hypothetical protein